MAKHHRDTRFMPDRDTGLVDSPNTHPSAPGGLANHAANSGRVDGVPVDPRVGTKHKTGVGTPVIHGGMLSMHGSVDARGGDAHSAVASGATTSFKDTLTAPPKVYADPPAAYGQRSRSDESRDPNVRGPGGNHAAHQGKGADAFAHALGRKIVQAAIHSGSSIFGNPHLQPATNAVTSAQRPGKARP